MTMTDASSPLSTGPAAASQLAEHLTFAVDEISRWRRVRALSAALLPTGRFARSCPRHSPS